MLDPTQPARVGNIYDLIAFQLIRFGVQEPSTHAVVIDFEGTVGLVGTEHADYGRLVFSDGFVGFLSSATDPARLSDRLAEAHRRVFLAHAVSA